MHYFQTNYNIVDHAIGGGGGGGNKKEKENRSKQTRPFTSKVAKLLKVGYEGGSESSVIRVITLLIYMIGCCIIP